ncbi:Protein CBG00015 [Caenorhabditis briggsae]|uniref:Protein CBG00015 n=1 Tax=Caenorhabditis briggsae TaxID=6238 RepID=A8WM51_CAEBR|nr:Protein CBG00015 [Caenorhabditis briggsae]CAP21555.1 Protein CBG00015 [Caenorhabditis briggsae]
MSVKVRMRVWFEILTIWQCFRTNDASMSGDDGGQGDYWKKKVSHENRKLGQRAKNQFSDSTNLNLEPSYDQFQQRTEENRTNHSFRDYSKFAKPKVPKKEPKKEEPEGQDIKKFMSPAATKFPKKKEKFSRFLSSTEFNHFFGEVYGILILSTDLLFV